MKQPQEPVRMTAGRYAEPLWDYDGKLYSYDEAGRRYEKDRADWLAARLAEAERDLEEAVSLLRVLPTDAGERRRWEEAVGLFLAGARSRIACDPCEDGECAVHPRASDSAARE